MSGDGNTTECGRGGRSADADGAALDALLAEPACRATLRFLRGVVGVVAVESVVDRVADWAAGVDGRPDDRTVTGRALRERILPALARLGVLTYDPNADRVWYNHDNPLDARIGRALRSESPRS